MISSLSNLNQQTFFKKYLLKLIQKRRSPKDLLAQVLANDNDEMFEVAYINDDIGKFVKQLDFWQFYLTLKNFWLKTNMLCI